MVVPTVYSRDQPDPGRREDRKENKKRRGAVVSVLLCPLCRAVTGTVTAGEDGETSPVTLRGDTRDTDQNRAPLAGSGHLGIPRDKPTAAGATNHSLKCCNIKTLIAYSYSVCVRVHIKAALQTAERIKS